MSGTTVGPAHAAVSRSNVSTIVETLLHRTRLRSRRTPENLSTYWQHVPERLPPVLEEPTIVAPYVVSDNEAPSEDAWPADDETDVEPAVDPMTASVDHWRQILDEYGAEAALVCASSAVEAEVRTPVFDLVAGDFGRDPVTWHTGFTGVWPITATQRSSVENPAA